MLAEAADGEREFGNFKFHEWRAQEVDLTPTTAIGPIRRDGDCERVGFPP